MTPDPDLKRLAETARDAHRRLADHEDSTPMDEQWLRQLEAAPRRSG
jgi:hypothetical protein